MWGIVFLEDRKQEFGCGVADSFYDEEGEGVSDGRQGIDVLIGCYPALRI